MGRGGGPVDGEIVSGMDMIEVLLGTGAWSAGVGLLVVMAALPWLDQIGGGR